MADHYDVFLSYSHNDLKAATVLSGQLEKCGLAVFWDKASIREGDLWLNRLQEAVDACGSFVVLVGRDGVRRWVGAETQAALTRYFGTHDDARRLPIFPILLGDTSPDTLPAFLRLFQGTNWNGAALVPDPLLKQIRERTIVASKATFEGCPFVGLDAYRPEQAHLFFGRQKETLDALACFDTRPGSPTVRWLEINGNSGSGKSSLMNAGLLPLIDQGWLWPRTGFETWRRIGPMMPGERPVEMLAQQLAVAFGCEMADVYGRLQANGHDALRMWLRSRIQSQTAFLLAIDQLQELFTFADPAERGHFDLILAAALEDADCPLFVISTVRADFLDRFDDLPRITDLRNRAGKQWTLPLISTDGLREVISGPAQLADLDVREVKEAMVAEAREEPGALPLVENALQWLWEHRTPDSRLSGQLFTNQGGLAGILSRSADELLLKLGDHRGRALELLLRLVKVDPEGLRHTRRRIPLTDAVAVAGGDKGGRDLVEYLAGTRTREVGPPRGQLRLITVTESAKGGTTKADRDQWVNLIHETLVRSKGPDAEGNSQPYWPSLWRYVEQNRGRALLMDRARLLALEIEAAAAAWDAANRPEELRWPEDRFQEIIRETRRSGVSLGAGVRSDLSRAFLGPTHPEEIIELLALEQTEDERAGSGRYGEFWRLPLGHLARAILGDRLALLGEQRNGVGLREGGLPNIDWCRIDGGEVTIDARLTTNVRTERGIKGALNRLLGSSNGVWKKRSKELRRVVEPFWMARYPVTIMQFRAFVEDCFRNGRWRLPPGFPADRLEHDPPTRHAGHGNHPADGVSWYHAMAFCHWLSACLGDRSDKKSRIRLPTEFEWQLAASGGNPANAYPWGHGWDPEREPWRANTAEGGLGRSTAVGLYPRGASKFGVLDMAGTVSEWCWNIHDDPDRTEFDARAQDPRPRVLRGGSWSLSHDGAECAYRYWYFPDSRSYYIGFRVVCSSLIGLP